MATKNKNIHTYDLDSVFAEYMAYLSDHKAEAIRNTNKTIEELEEEIEILKAQIADLAPLLRKKKDPNYQANLEESNQLKEDKKAREAELKKYKAELKELGKDIVPDIDSFKQFLEDNNLSTVHAEELLKFYNNAEQFQEITYADFKMRKMHPKRDYVIKKVVIPTAIASVGIGAAIGTIAASGLVGGTEVLGGLITVSGTPGMIEAQAATVGGTIGLLATPTIIKGKNLITRTYYRLKSKNAEANLNDYVNGTEIENLNLIKLIAKIRKTNRSILESGWVKKHTLNVINRNRIHQVEAVTKDLVKLYRNIEQDQNLTMKAKSEALQPIYSLLAEVQDLISTDIAESKVHAMLTCKSKSKDSHPSYLIENVDIYANLVIYIDRILKVDAEHSNEKAQLKNAKTTTKNLNQKKAEAYKLITGEKMLTRMLNFEEKYSKYLPKQGPASIEEQIEKKPTKTEKTSTQVETQEVPVEKKEVTTETKEVPVEKKPSIPQAKDVKVVSHTVDLENNQIKFKMENGKTAVVSTSEVADEENVVSIKSGSSNYTLTYKDGKQVVASKPKKVIPEIKTARISLLEKLNSDETFVKELKEAGFQTQTIKKLIEKTTIWLENTNQKFALSGRYKELYLFAIAKINASVAAQEEIAFAEASDAIVIKPNPEKVVEERTGKSVFELIIE